MDVRKMRNEVLGKRVVAALESRNMEAYYVETKELPYGLITTIVTIMGFSFIVQGVVDFLKNYMGYGTVDVFVVLVEFLIGVVSIIASSVFTVIRKNSSVEEIADEI